MDAFDIPILAKAYELYKLLCGVRNGIPKSDRHTLWQKIEGTSLDLIESLLLAGQGNKERKCAVLEEASMRLNMLRMFLRLARDTRTLDLKKSVHLQQIVDEIGRMLGGWIKSAAEHGKPPPEEFLKQ